MTERTERLVWMDLEMTGLDPERHRILETATLVTDAALNVVAVGPVMAVHQPPEVLKAMEDWSRRTHTASGLLARVEGSKTDTREAERLTLKFIRQWVKEGASPLCGNSVHQDRRFLVREMPELNAYLHYRIIDVSSVKELVKRWYPQELQAPPKRRTHQALEDIEESIAELRWYREHVFVDPAGQALD
ncbi:MAG: oligoribonuclease [Dehalococcoidia bacterium]